jgi:hypothetical protein
MSRILFATAMVAAAWTLAISGLVAIGDAHAEAAWLKSGPGASAAKAIKLVLPGDPTPTAVKCNNSGGTNPSVTLQWTYSGSTPPRFGIYSAAAPGTANPPSVATTTTSPITIALENSKTVYLSVRAVAGSWLGPRSGEVKVC